jgi:RHH-type proline utilization regulon transcriptional repressor/proline dehydrogenase/delta 1-pyrroline-5-carboxylate dehydrogenase
LLLHEAGVPVSALHLVQGDGRIGAALVATSKSRRCLHRLDEVARSINRRSAGRSDRAAEPETGGINAMIERPPRCPNRSPTMW